MFQHLRSGRSASGAKQNKLVELERRNLRARRLREIAIEQLERRCMLSVQYSGDGLLGQYYDDLKLQTPLLSRVDPTVNFPTQSSFGLPKGNAKFSATWSGFVGPAASGDYTLYATSQDGVRLWVDGKLVIDDWRSHSSRTDKAHVTLEAGKLYPIRMSFYQASGSGTARLEWASGAVTRRVIPQSQLYSQGRQIPFAGVPFATGQTIQAEDYDYGGQGISFNDLTAGNSGGVYRGDAVDISRTSDGYVVTNFTRGEWLEYTVDIPSDGKYDLDLQASGSGGAGLMAVSMDGQALGSLNVGDTKGAWTSVAQSGVQLTAGVHAMRVAVDKNSATAFVGGLDWMRVLPAASQLATTDSEAFVPQQIGTGQGADEKAIARWDVVPYQTFSGDFNVGVVAFHMNDIDHVDFSVEGGPWVSVSQMTLNPQTNVVEYWTTLHASDYRDGNISIRAIAYPKTGVPRLLQGSAAADGEATLNLTANSHHSFTPATIYVSVDGSDANPGTRAQPFQTLTKALGVVSDGGTVVITSPGSYAVNKQAVYRQNSQWITVTADQGLDRDQVIITQPSRTILRPAVARLHWLGVSFDFHTISQYYPESTDFVWFDHCKWFDSAGWTALYDVYPSINVRSATTIGGSFATNSLADNLKYGFSDMSFVRDCDMHMISNDALTNTEMSINSTVDTMDVTIAGTHDDVLQYFGPHENVIAYGITASNLRQTQGIYLDKSSSTFSDMAFVNITMETLDTAGSPPFSQLCSNETNVFFKNIQIPNQRAIFRNDFPGTSQFLGRDVVFDSCGFFAITALVPPSLPMGVTVR